MTIFTDKHLKSNWPDITLVHKNNHEWIRIHSEVLWDENIIKAYQVKYIDVLRPDKANQRLYQAAAQFDPFVVGTRDTISKILSTS